MMMHPGWGMPPGWGEKVENHLVVLLSVMIIEMNIKVLKMHIPSLLPVWMNQQGDKHLRYQEGQWQLLPITEAVL